MARRIAITCIVAVTLAYYFWTAMAAPGGPPRIHGNESDHFNLLSRGFRKGHLHLDHDVPAGLLQATNPYDPALRQTVPVLHDASYFRGKYYIYFGPAPVVTLLLPFRLLTGRDLPLPYAVWVFSSVGYLALVGILLFIQRRYFPRASFWSVTAGLFAVGGASTVVALLRRSAIWELSAAAGFGFFATSLLCLVRAMHASRPRPWATLGGLALGLAIASRPTYLLCSVLFALPWLFRLRDGSVKKVYDWHALLGAVAGCCLPVFALLVYNYARFGNPLEFGQKYQLSAIIEGDARHFSLSYVLFNFRVYFLSVLRWLPHFPFVTGIAVPPLPPGHGGHEYTFGLFANLPFSFFSLITLAGLAGWRTRGDLPRMFWLSAGMIAGAAALNVALLLCYFGSCIRYVVDFAPWVMLLAAIGVFLGEERIRSGVARFLLRGCALVLAIFSAFTAAAAVVNFYDPVPGEPPRAYRPVARALNAPIFWLNRQRWPDFRPQEIELSFPANREHRQEPIVAVNRAGLQTAVVFVDYLDDEKVRFGYREIAGNPVPVFSPAVLTRPGSRHALRLSLGGPYADFDGLRARLRAHWDNAAFWDAPVVSFGAYPGKLIIGAEAAGTSGGPRFSGMIHSVRPIVMPGIPRPRMAGIRVRITLKPEMAGHAYPLLTTGRTKAGDSFFIRVQSDHKMSFGYDHWGHALITSPEIAARIGDTPVVEFWVPALAPPGAEPVLLVKVDGTTVWQRTVPAYPITPETLFLGANPIGASHCEPMLVNAVFEDVHLAAPR